MIAAVRDVVIDAHTHIFPEEFTVDRSRALAADRWFGDLYAAATAKMATAEDLVASMDEAGIDVSIACGFPWRDPALCREHNAYLADAARRFPGRIAWLATVSPESATAGQDTIDALASGASGVGELNADAQSIELEHPGGIDQVAAACAQAGLPLMLHASEPVGHTYPGKGTATPDRFAAFAGRNPATTVIAAHWGGGLPFYELMPEVRAACANVVYDSAASTYLYDWSVFRRVIDLVGADRVLFGSDYPLLAQRRFLARATAALDPGGETTAVLGGNALKLFRIEPVEEP